MSKLVQSITLRITDNHEQALKEIKELKTFLEAKGVGVRAFWTLEGGAESGTGIVAMEFPDAAAWAALVDSDDAEMQALRRRGVEHPGVVIGTALLQEVDLSS
jgi:hypothetical protein